MKVVINGWMNIRSLTLRMIHSCIEFFSFFFQIIWILNNCHRTLSMLSLLDFISTLTNITAQIQQWTNCHLSYLWLLYKPVVYCKPHIFCSIIQCNMGIFRTELNILATGIWHCKRQAHGFKFFWGSFIVSDIHKSRNKILINLLNIKQN